MSMTREEAINRIKDHMAAHHIGEYPHIKLKEALDMAISALRPVSREQVERMRGEWEFDAAEPNGKFGGIRCSKCHKAVSFGDENAFHNAKVFEHYCSNCGSPMTDEAVDMVMERMEALHGE